MPLDPPWRKKLDRLALRRDALSAGLARLHARLRLLVAAESPELLPRLEKEAPQAVRTGYGIVPPVAADEPESAGTSPVEQGYSMVQLEQWIDKEQALLEELGSRLELRPLPLEREVDAYNRRAETFRTIDSHFGYHSFWQGQVPKWPAFWEQKRQLLALYRTWRAAGQSDTPQGTEARGKLEQEMLRITPSPFLALEEGMGEGATLPVRIATDITDEAFLAAFADAVERHWNESRAMKEARLRVDLAWDRVDPASLYPEGAPRRGDRIDLERHRKRFGSAPFLLTTGAESTHVLHAAIFLGARPVSPRVLAHEFAHLVGFGDAYIRAYDGSAEDPDGVFFREVTPFPESLLASPGRGKVTPRMAEVLRKAYRR